MGHPLIAFSGAGRTKAHCSDKLRARFANRAMTAATVMAPGKDKIFALNLTFTVFTIRVIRESLFDTITVIQLFSDNQHIPRSNAWLNENAIGVQQFSASDCLVDNTGDSVIH